MKLDIILRTHSTSSLHAGARVAPVSKEELVLKCAMSIIHSANQAIGHDIVITIVDDHSTPSCVEGLEKIISASVYPARLLKLDEPGHAASLMTCYEHARDHARDILYFIEDDYLHYPSAISEMLESYGEFKENLGGTEVGLLANDDPDSYRMPWIEPCRIVLGKHRHWRTNLFSTGTFMLSKNAFLNNWALYMKLVHYGEAPEITEATTVDLVWRNNVRLFTPIPALAFHMQFQENIAPFRDWKALWDLIPWPEV